MSAANQQLITALLAFADKRGHWPECPRTRAGGRSTTEDRDGNTIISPCSKRCRQARAAIEAAGGMVEQPPPQVRGPRDKRTLHDLFGHHRGCSLIPGAEYHHAGCKHREAVA